MATKKPNPFAKVKGKDAKPKGKGAAPAKGKGNLPPWLKPKGK